MNHDDEQPEQQASPDEPTAAVPTGEPTAAVPTGEPTAAVPTAAVPTGEVGDPGGTWQPGAAASTPPIQPAHPGGQVPPVGGGSWQAPGDPGTWASTYPGGAPGQHPGPYAAPGYYPGAGAHAPAGGPGPYPGGPAGGPPPGSWGAPPWWDHGPGPWGQPHAPASTHPVGRLAVVAVVGAVVAAALGVVIGHAVWQPPPVSSSVGIALPGSGGSGSGGSGSGGSGSGGSGSGGPSNASAIAQRVSPALVDINTTLNYQNEQAAGTGMVLTSNGEVLTNNHVIESSTSISVTDIGNGKTYAASVVGYDRTKDVAVLQLKNASGLTTVTTGDSSSVRTGDQVVAIGNAGGVGGTPSVAGGAVTALNQSITASDQGDGTTEQLSGLIETDADIQPGDSGGPLVNTSGKVIGMDTAASAGFQFQPTGGSGVQGYSIPINEALSIVRQIESGTATSSVHLGPTPFLGVQVTAPGGSSGSGFGGFGGIGSGIGSGSGGSQSSAGAQILTVIPGQAAANAGLQAGDVITSVGGHTVTSVNDLAQIMLEEKVGATVPVVYTDTSGQQRTVSVTLGSGPPQ